MGRPWAEATILGLAAAVEVLSLSLTCFGSLVLFSRLEFVVVFQELAPITKKPAVFYDVLNTKQNL